MLQPIPDFHTHILPGIDDGSSDVEESLKMLGLLSNEGVKRVVATPHFYPTRESLKAFLTRRKEAVAKLKKAVGEEHPEIYLASEVAYYRGISNSDEIREICLCGTDYILVEMPYGKWDDKMVEDIVGLKEKAKLIPILAHIERFYGFIKKRHFTFLNDNCIIMQSNSSAYTIKGLLKKTVALTERGSILLLGSDAHDTEIRKPNTKAACEVIKARCSEGTYEKMAAFGNNILDQATRVI